MASRTALLVLATAFTLGTACGDDDTTFVPVDASTPPDAYVGPSTTLFEVPRGGEAPPSGFYALPFPNDIRMGADGRMDLSDYVRPNVLLDKHISTYAEKVNGFSINGAVFFRFAHPIDPTSLPAEPTDALAADASVYLVNVDPDSADRGGLTPLRFRFEHFAGETIGDDWLSVLPYPGFTLEEGTTYAAVVTNRILAPDGTAVAAAPDFAAILSTEAPADADLARAQQLYQPLLDWLDEPGGDERADVISAAVFTTGNFTRDMAKLREATFALDEPKARDIEWLGELDDFVWYDGVYDAPNYQTGEPPYMTSGGEIVFDDETGLPIVQRWEEMRLSFSVPKGDMPEGGWPVVLYAHGTGGSYHTFKNNGTAARLAQHGIACVGIDQVLHGPRNPGANPEITFFNFQNPLAARDNTRQGAADNFQLLRLVKGFDYTERHPGGRTIRFDPDRIYFFGHSQGGLTGPAFLAYEPEIPGAILSGAAGLLYLALLNKTEPQNIPELLGVFIRDYPLDEFNPVLSLLQMWLDASDPASFGPLLFSRPAPGIPPKNIFHSEGFTDHYAPNVGIEAFAVTMRSDPVTPILKSVEGMDLRGLQPVNPPVANNRGSVTAVFLQYDQQQGSDGHYVLFDIAAAKKQSIEFLSTLAETGTATLVAP